MTLNFNAAGDRVEDDKTSEVKPVILEFQPVLVTAGCRVITPAPEPVPVPPITIDPEKVGKPSQV